MSPVATMVPSMGLGPGGALGTRVAEGLHVPLLLRGVIRLHGLRGYHHHGIPAGRIFALIRNRPRHIATRHRHCDAYGD